MSKVYLALVISSRGHIWNGLQSILRTMPRIEIIAEANDPSILMKIGSEIEPKLVLFEANLFEQKDWAGIIKNKIESPQTIYIALVDDGQQYQIAQKSGADLVLMKGLPAKELILKIEEILE